MAMSAGHRRGRAKTSDRSRSGVADGIEQIERRKITDQAVQELLGGLDLLSMQRQSERGVGQKAILGCDGDRRSEEVG